jgi:hypothetical protein
MTWPNWSEVAEVLKALAAVLWPVAIIVVILTFRKDVRGLIAGLKLRRGKLFGQEFEFELDKLEKETRPLAEPSSTAAQQPPTDILQRILREAASSPKAALMYLQAEIERQLRAVLASRGVDPRDVRSVPYQRAMDLFRGSDEVSQEFPRWLQEFRNIRNIIIHGHGATDEDALRAIDIGARILSVLNTTLAAKVVTDSKASGTLQ